MEHLELKKENDWILETTNFTISDKKCGEIFVQTNEKFYIVCTFCITRFAEFEEFTTHYSHKHSNEPALYLNDTLKFIKTEPEENLCSDSNINVNQCDENVDNTKDTGILNETDNNDDTKIVCKEEIVSCKSKENEKSKKFQAKKRPMRNRSSTIKKERTVSKRGKRKRSYNFSCDLCEKKFTSSTQLEDHKKYDHLSINDPFLNHVITDIQLNRNSDDSEDDENDKSKSEQIQQIKVDPKKCRYCSREFGHRFERIQHERTNHTGEKPFKCKHCNKSFAILRYCKQHEKLHLGIKPHQCNLCGALFGVKGNLATHLRRHKGEKSHSCSFCEKKFFDNAEKEIHERIHTGEKPYQCITCGKCFITSSHMVHHRKLHHSTDVEKPHTCEICNKCFVTKGMLREHSASHSDVRPFKCDICGKAFKWRKGLKSHEKIHSEVTNYTCNICGKGFKQYSGLYCHTKVHEKVA